MSDLRTYERGVRQRYDKTAGVALRPAISEAKVL
jgi:hypothetical protein